MLNSNYIVVHVDVGKYDKNLELAKKYHVNLEKGVPSLAVLDAQGKVLYGTSDFERARMMSEDDVIQFLDKWKPAAEKKQRQLGGSRQQPFYFFHKLVRPFLL